MKTNPIGKIAILCGALGLLYGQFLWNAIVFDDLPFFMVNDAGHQPVDDFRYSPFELRSLPYATLAWGKALFGLELWHFRVENLLLHAAVTVALFFFLARLFAGGRDSSRPGVVGMNPDLPGARKLSPEALAFCAALLFTLHPVAVYAVGYLVQRSIVMATLFSLLAMLAWLHGNEHESKPWLWASVLFYYLAVFSKEHAIMLPAVLLALTVLQHEDVALRLKRHWPVWLGLGLIALFVVASKKGILGSVYEIDAPEMLGDAASQLNYPLSVLTQSGLFFKYAALWLFPNPNWMSVDMREPFAASLWSGYLAALLAWLGWGAGAIYLLFKRGRLGLLGFALLFPWLMFWTELSTVRIQESFVLYRSYLWAVGACALLPLLLGHLDRRLAGVVVGAAALAMVPISMDRLASFSHPLILWDDAVKLVKDKPDLPGVYRIYYNRGTERSKVGDYDGAIEDLKLAAQLNPDWPFAYHNLGAAYGKKGEWALSVAAFSAAIDVAERKQMGFNPKPYHGRALSYQQMGRPDLARRDYELTCKLANKGCEKLGGSESSDLSTKSLPGTKAAH